MMVSFVLSFIPRDVLDESLDLIESVPYLLLYKAGVLFPWSFSAHVLYTQLLRHGNAMEVRRLAL